MMFGDSERADMVDGAGILEVDQVAIRLHEDCVALEQLAGRPAAHWHALTDDDRTAGLIVAAVFVNEIREGTRDLARLIHEARRRFDPSLPAWYDLDPPDLDVALTLVEGIVDRLIIEGTYPR